MKEKTDKELYKEFLQGDKKSFEEIIIRYKDKIIYFLQRYVRDVYIAEDLAQDVFVYLLIHKENYNFDYSFKTYLYIIAKSKALNYLRRERRIVALDEAQMYELEGLEDKIFEKEERDNIRNSIKKLKLEYQSAIYLADIEELSYREIGRVLNKTESNVKVLIHRSRKALEKIIREERVKYEG